MLGLDTDCLVSTP